ncbi:hypothetical protein NPIL_41771 [Nephila pilipes]|uniref:Uncharacterized protein n=1 Tax=Nephila pilipes TaxID=299642 RepID=A0A8X6NKB3_NEPPI|nr:hypothetical protein NPIL_41771 [Nephila pilipes]
MFGSEPHLHWTYCPQKDMRAVGTASDLVSLSWVKDPIPNEVPSLLCSALDFYELSQPHEGKRDNLLDIIICVFEEEYVENKLYGKKQAYEK